MPETVMVRRRLVGWEARKCTGGILSGGHNLWRPTREWAVKAAVAYTDRSIRRQERYAWRSNVH